MVMATPFKNLSREKLSFFHHWLTRPSINSILFIMQEKSFAKNQKLEALMYIDVVARPLKTKRPAMGEHLATLRKQAGLSQYELAKLLNEPQSNVSFWELNSKPPRSDILPRLAKILGVRVETILNVNAEKTIRRGGPKGKVQKIFEDLSQLPKKQQEKIVDVISAFVSQYQNQQQ